MAPVPKAKSRLFDLRTQAVGIVGRAANQRTFLVLKNEDGVPEDTLTPKVKAEPPAVAAEPSGAVAVTDPGASAPLAMPSATKTALATLLATMLDTMSGIASAVESSTVDDAAPMPADILMQLDVLSEGLDEGIEAMVPSDELAPEFVPGEETPVEKADKATPPVSRARRLLAQKRLKSMTELHKSINEGHSMIGKGMTGIAKMMGELSGKAPKADGKEPAVEAEKTEKSAGVDTAALFSDFKSELLEEVKKVFGAAFAPIAARSQAASLRASVPLPNAAAGDGHAARPAVPVSGNFKSMLRDAQDQAKKKT